MRRTIVAGFLAAAVFAFVRMPAMNVLHAGQEPPKSPRLFYLAYMMAGHGQGLRTANLYVLTGDDHHTFAIDAEDQIILVDTKSTPGWAAPMMQRLEAVSDQQVMTLINTSMHQGGSNAEFPMVVDIIAHENARKRMATRAGANAKLPNKTFKDKLTLAVNTIGTENGSNRLDLLHFGPAYTDGDTIVVAPQYNALYLGELFPGKEVPLVDRANGGSAIQFPDTLDKAVAALKSYIPFQMVVPGRETPRPRYAASVTNWKILSDFEEYAAFTWALVDASRAAHQAKKSVDDAVAGFSLPERFKGYSLDRLRPFVQAVYDELR